MVEIGYHASHEQHTPRELLAAVRLAELVGFDEVMCSDHLAPWTTAQGQSGFAWSWLGAAMAQTGIPFGLVNAPGQRYHPVVIAQAIGTLAQMFPERFWIAFGSGENLNEHVTGDAWPDKPVRQRRLRESVDAIRALLDGQRVDVDGLIRIHDARIWTLPEQPISLVGAAVSAETAEWVAEWGDGMITVGCQAEQTAEVLRRFRDAGGRGPARLQIHLSLEPTREAALATAREQWSQTMAQGVSTWDVENPEDFEAAIVPSDDALEQGVLISHDPADLAEQIAEVAHGYDRIYLHHVGRDQADFLRRCETELLPRLRSLL
ncbi:TIGR03885 family FMN-dependent LLM class oxidoreductase [Microbacterium hydrocarbonoxydans]|uniref:TIGR03885 family FMN-dependent LLM class oxidoreductase n=1 Tax=Microbacterium hydrocarbonoxydans TaxID=273678 RepID=UPI00203AA841|nr:TIGR03885 family FMN-dependent LLM class oxidoreductase [Microbacterium hydrocarbonoxydans]MCM3778698.1 TIGR03885 family FMN-dependent LLM class oxidoreductase [Microbacterium hydrocarbonoxydans]